jgi:hypothetical protein
MHEHFYSVSYSVHGIGEAKSTGGCLLRASRVPTLDSVRNHIRKHFLANPKAVISITEVESLSKEVYIQLGGDEKAPLLQADAW